MNVEQTERSSFDKEPSFFISTIIPDRPLLIARGFFSLALGIAGFALVSTAIFYVVAPLSSSAFPTIPAYLIQLIIPLSILLTVHVSAPALMARGIRWEYFKIYITLLAVNTVYAFTLRLLYIDPVSFITMAAISLLCIYFFPSVRVPLNGFRRSTRAFLSALVIIITVSGSTAHAKAVSSLHSTQASVIRVNSKKVSGYTKTKPKKQNRSTSRRMHH